MQFLYTGAQSYQAPQPDANLSLGGFISGTVIPNGQMNNIFSDISYQTAKRKSIEVRGIVLKNTLGINATDVIFGYTYPDNVNFKIEVAFVTINAANPTMIEKIGNGQSNPYTGIFQEASIASIDNSVDIGSLVAGASIAIWLRRTMTGVFTPPTFADVPSEVAYWKALSDPAADQTQLTNIILKYTVNQ